MPATNTPADMVLIPSGAATVGADDDYAEEAPAHRVTVDAFAMDRYPATNAQFKTFCDATDRPYPTSPRWEAMPDSFLRCPDHPVVNVSYDDATAYAAWAGKRLPTEVEWECAARGGLAGARYPWGDAPAGNHAQYASRDSAFPWRDWRVSTGYPYTAPVGSFAPNGYGLYDMAGNVWEWCANHFYAYPGGAAREDQQPPAEDGWGRTRVLRGGAFSSTVDDLRVARRLRVFGTTGGNGMGFRCVRTSRESGGWEEPSPPIPPTRKTPPVRTPLEMRKGVELCAGVPASLSDETAAEVRELGFTSVEQYVTWETVENTAEGAFDFSHWDEQVAVLERHGLQWVPFLIAGPAYSLPDWYRRSDEFRGYVCLEHVVESGIQSSWDPACSRHIERFIAAFAERYRDSGVIESLLLGITGDFGEAIYPVTGTTWPTVIPGPYHTHEGYWCGDRIARDDFRRWSLDRHDGALATLNEAWGTTYGDPAEIALPQLDTDGEFRVDEPTRAGIFAITSSQDRRRWIEFVDWYRASMNGLARTWLDITRRHFPDHPIYLCTGGHAPPSHGAHFGDQCQLAAEAGAGIRITNEASNYPLNFTLTQWVASAGRFYGAYYGFEPAGGIDEKGITARVFNATAAGAANLHFYATNVTKNVDAWRANYDHLTVGRPNPQVAVLYPDTPVVVGDLTFSEVAARLAVLRDGLDLAFVDEAMIAAGSGALDGYRALIIIGGMHYRTDAITAIASWQDAGGALAVFGTDALHTIDGEDVTKQLRQSGAHWVGQVEVAEALPRLVTWLRGHDVLVIDGVADQVYVTQLADRILVLHHGDDGIEKELTLPGGEQRIVQLPPNTITEIEVSDAER